MKIACIQLVSSVSIDKNLAEVDKLIGECEQDFDLLALPENFALMHKGNLMEYAEGTGDRPIQDYLSNLAKTKQCWIQAGTLPIQSPEQNKAYSAACFYNDMGDCVEIYHKRYLFDVQVSEKESYRESDTYLAGSKLSKVIDSPWGKLGVMICYDLRFAENILNLVEQNVDVIFVPSAFTFQTGQQHWWPLLQARAIESQSFVIGCNQGGKHENGRHTYGHTVAFGPYGRKLASLETGSGIFIIDIDMSEIQKVRSNMPMAHTRAQLK